METGDKEIFHNTTISPHWVTLPAQADYVVFTGNRESVVGPLHGLAEAERYCRGRLGPDVDIGDGVIEAYEAKYSIAVMPLDPMPDWWRPAATSGEPHVLAFCDYALGPVFGSAEVVRYCREALSRYAQDADWDDDDQRAIDNLESPDDVMSSFFEVYEGVDLHLIEP
jgi:hypothetical protein